MIPKYIDDWLTIIEQMNNDNTYKLAWGRAIIECVNFSKYQEKEDELIISFDDISKFMVKYYWNQLFFFKLKQSPYADKDPVICKYVNVLIEEWKMKKNSSLPVWYDEEKVKINNPKLFNKTIDKVSKILHQNVSWRFKNVSGGQLEIYHYENNVDQIIIKREDAFLLKGEYGLIISKLLNYKWAKLLEKFNIIF